jgi:hypothetical protein
MLEIMLLFSSRNMTGIARVKEGDFCDEIE